MLESVISDRGSQFTVDLTKKLNQIQTKLFMAFHPQKYEQIKYINQELEQYLQFSVNHRQNVRNRPATKPVMLKVYNVELSFDIWLVLYIYFILYS